MRPTKLIIDGFLSYRNKEVIDFSKFDIACITGENGAGKSSILDAITFALYGSARVKNADGLINLGREEAQVTFEFTYDDIEYRIVRTVYKKTTKPTTVDLSYFDPSAKKYDVITETTRTKTDAKIEQILKLDIETFKSTSFFLQGQADFFATSDPGKRREILGKILQLEKWDGYHKKANEQKKATQSEIKSLNDQLKRLNEDIKPESDLKKTLENYEQELKELSTRIVNTSLAFGDTEKLLSNIGEAKNEIERNEKSIGEKDAAIRAKKEGLTEKVNKFNDVQSLIDNADAISTEVSELKNKQKILSDQSDFENDLRLLNNNRAAISGRIDLLNKQLDDQIEKLKEEGKKIADGLSKLPELAAEREVLVNRSKRSDTLQTEQDTLEGLKNQFIAFGSKFNEWTILNNKIKQDKKEHQEKISKLTDQRTKFEDAKKTFDDLTTRYEIDTNTHKNLSNVKVQVDQLKEIITKIEGSLSTLRNKKAEIGERLEHIVEIHSANCPTCEQTLTEEDRDKLIQKLEKELSEIDRDAAELTNRKNSTSDAIRSALGTHSDEKSLENLITNLITTLIQTQTKLEQLADIDQLWTDQDEAELKSLSVIDGADPREINELNTLAGEIKELSRTLEIHSNNLDAAGAKQLIEQKTKEIQNNIEDLKNEISSLKEIPTKIGLLDDNVRRITESQNGWLADGAKRLEEIEQQKASSANIQAELKELAEIDKAISLNGFDETIKLASEKFITENGVMIQERSSALSSAPARKTELEADIRSIQNDIDKLNREKEDLKGLNEEKQKKIVSEPELNSRKEVLTRSLIELKEKETNLNQDIGSTNKALETIKEKKQDISSFDQTVEELKLTVINLEILEKAFGKKGIPTLLIDQARPDIEFEANKILSRLTDGFSIKIETQADYRDKNRTDQKEVLDISISDGSGTRSYESYSGGEAFRVNFALRLALSKMLAHRANAKLELLVIDEGFGSQDDTGKQKLVEAIKTVQPDFAKILVITHMDDLKERFDNRIEVEKYKQASRINVV